MISKAIHSVLQLSVIGYYTCCCLANYCTTAFYLPLLIICRKKISLHHNIKSSQSTCIVGDPIGGAFEVSFDSTKDLTLRLVVPQEQDTNIMDN